MKDLILEGTAEEALALSECEFKRQLLATLGAIRDGDFSSLNQHGSLNANASPIKDGAGVSHRFLLYIMRDCIRRDITERRRIEAEVLEAPEREQRRIAQTCTTGWGGNWPASPG